MNEVNLNKYKKEYLENLGKLIAFKTNLTAIEDYPTDQQKKILEFIVELGNKYGFRTFNDPDGHYAYLEIGEGEELVGILGHVDVVPPGNINKWETDPFKLVVKDQYLIGRGTIDDKGPVLLAFYVLKALLDNKVKLNKRYRLIIGNDEESLWRGIAKYKEEQENPTVGFTPDATFPVIYGEKGLLEWYLEEEIDSKQFKIYGGEAINAVPDQAFYEGKEIEKIIENLDKFSINYEKKDGKIIVHGQAAHAMVPEEGINALGLLIKALDGIVESKILDFIRKELKQETNGISLFGKEIKDQETGSLTVNLGKITIEGNKLKAYFDHRIPVVASSLEEIESGLKAKLAKYNLEYHYFDSLKLVYEDKNSDLIKMLMNAYKKIYKDKKEPYTIGGATYARAMDNILAFGPMIEEEENLEHQPNEKIKISILEKAFLIYYDLLITLNDK